MRFSLPTLKIRSQVLLFGLIMSTLPLIVMTTYYLLEVKKDLEYRIEDKQELKISNLANQIEIELEKTFQQMEMLAVVYEMDNHNSLFYDFLRQNKSIEEVVIVDGEGLISKKLSRFELNTVETGEQWLDERLKQQLVRGLRMVDDVKFNSFGQPVIKLALPMIDIRSGEYYGGIGITLQLQKIIGEISSYQLNEPGYIYLVDQNDRIIAHQDYARLWTKNSTKPHDDLISAQSNIDDLQWRLVLEQPRQQLLTPVYVMLKKSIVVAFFFILLISVVSVYAGLYFVKPIELLQGAIMHLKKGQWPPKVKLSRRDELGDLATAFNDMSEDLKEKSNTLLQEKERLNIIVNGLRAGLAVIRSDYTIVWMNPTLQEWLDTKIGMPCYRIFNDIGEPCVKCPAFNDYSEEYDETVTSYDKNGQKRIFRHRVYPLKHSYRAERESLLLIEDITEKKEMEAVLTQADKLSALGLMSSSFAHEVNNPLATVKVYAEDLIDRLEEEPNLLKEEVITYLQTISQNIDRCKTITSNLLNFSRKSDWTEKSVNVNEVIENSVELVYHTIKKRGITLNRHLETNFPPVLGDSLNLMQVIVNIITNAADAIEKENGEINISSKWLKEDNEIEINISDNGVGIEQKDLTRVYDPFYTTKPVGKGTGLGLSVCYGIIHQFGGTISITSEKEIGTTVNIKIPAFQLENEV